MTEPREYPLTRALLAEMLALDETDTQLPLQVLVNLHRPQLQAPLIALAAARVVYNGNPQRMGGRELTFKDHLHDRYGLDATLLANSGTLILALGVLDGAACRTIRRSIPGWVGKLLGEAVSGWEPFDALTLLYYAGAGVEFSNVAPALELELSLEPGVCRLIMDMGSRPVQAE